MRRGADSGTVSTGRGWEAQEGGAQLTVTVQELLTRTDMPGGASCDRDPPAGYTRLSPGAHREPHCQERDANVGMAGVVQHAEGGEDGRSDSHLLHGGYRGAAHTCGSRRRSKFTLLVSCCLLKSTYLATSQAIWTEEKFYTDCYIRWYIHNMTLPPSPPPITIFVLPQSLSTVTAWLLHLSWNMCLRTTAPSIPSSGHQAPPPCSSHSSLRNFCRTPASLRLWQRVATVTAHKKRRLGGCPDTWGSRQ